MSFIRAVALCAAVVGAPALAQEKAAVKPGFSYPRDHPIRILVFRPDVRAGSQSAGGAITPQAEWTRDARNNIATALTAAHPGGAAEVVFLPDAEGETAAVLADYRALFGAVADTVLQHRLFKGDRLPTKKTGFEYTVGPGIAKLATLAGGGDYALFVATNDNYGSTGRKLLQLAAVLASTAAGGFGPTVTSGQHTGYAGLIDLKSGDLIWMNADARMGGDVRAADGATKRVAQLLEDFPVQPAATDGARP
ncbi:hypothetical protein [uncultured Sphingomonas sp.]|uniref:hypothetical protein n=1 Tax=uncultured Sphingomonas sp. TaxID=158754 RepID=UPI00374A632D